MTLIRPLLIVLLLASSASAQSPADEAARLAAGGDTAQALQVLQRHLEKNPRDAAGWYQTGMLAWEYSRHTKRGSPMPPHLARARMLADSSLRLAAQFADTNATYWYDLTKFALNTGNVFVRAGVRGFLNKAATIAEKNDPFTYSRIRDEQGMERWRVYLTTANKALLCVGDAATPNAAPSIHQGINGAPMNADGVPVGVRRDQWAGFADGCLQALRPPAGLTEYREALEHFQQAVRADSLNWRALSHLLMAYAERGHLDDLRHSAERATTLMPDSALPWLVRGYAAVRSNDMRRAAMFFDSASVRLEDEERDHYTSFARLIAPRAPGKETVDPDSVRYFRASDAERAEWEARFWYRANPRAGTNFNEARLEYIARVVEADLLFSSEDLDMRGANSDMGQTLIRYGPPPRKYLVHNELNAARTIFWTYNNGLAFVFNMMPTFGVAYTPRTLSYQIDSIREEKPHAWDNIKEVNRTVPMLIHTARFRSAHRDSMDVVVASAIPTLAMLQGSELGGQLPIDVQFDVQDPQVRIVGRERQQTTVQGERLPIAINAHWHRRLARGLNVVRIDAEQKDVERAAVVTADVTALEAGFAMSDVLFTQSIAAQSGTRPGRWNDLALKPVVAAFATSQPVGLVWESYELANRDGDAHYRVTIELERTFQSSLRGLGARIVANFRNVVEGTNRGTGALQVSFDQTRPHSGALVDYIQINLSQSVAGRYRVTVHVQDLVTSQRTSRTTHFTLVQ